MSVDQFLLSADTTDLNYPEIRPTLDLNFARVKALDPRITFTRSSGGSYVGADGLIKYAGVNEARFDHDPETGESLGLLIEESRSNLLLRSEVIGGPNWSSVTGGIGMAPVITQNAGTSPTGSNNATRIVLDIAGGTVSADQSGVRQTVSSLPDPHIVAMSVWLKSYDGTTYTIQLRDVVNNFTLCTVDSTWKRFTHITDSRDSTANNLTLWVRGTGGSSKFADILAWGAQLEVGAFPTSYIPTQASTRTRAADNARIIGKNFSEWYRQDEGTIYTSFNNNNIKNSSFTSYDFYIATFTNSSNSGQRFSNRIATIGTQRGRIRNFINDGNLFQYAIEDDIYIFGIAKTINSYRLVNDFVSVFNNFNLKRNVTGNIENVIFNQLLIGRDSFNVYRFNGTISRLTYFPKRLPNAQLQALTR
jgi:hypothetical protein